MQSSKRIIAGVDEVGRGPLAGPVVACAVVILSKHSKLSSVKFANLTELSFKGLRDSKQLSAKQREAWYRVFQRDPNIQWAIGKAGERLIERINIRQATKLAMERAVKNLSKIVLPDLLYIDGTMALQTPIVQRALIKADEKILVCTIASIIAKVTRDRFMMRFHKHYPQYGFDRHKGYATLYHRTMLQKYGPCPIHRATFSPVASWYP